MTITWRRLQASPQMGWTCSIDDRPAGEVFYSPTVGEWFACAFKDWDRQIVDLWSVGQFTAWAAMSWLRRLLSEKGVG